MKVPKTSTFTVQNPAPFGAIPRRREWAFKEPPTYLIERKEAPICLLSPSLLPL